MHIDSSRSRFDAAKRYSGVLALQGRVPLDSDQTEAQQILLHYLRAAVADIVGPAAVPSAASGFAVKRATADKLADLSISAGRMYVDGILVENAEDSTYWTQPDGHLDTEIDGLPEQGAYLAYLRVWEREVTVVQDPNLREVALGIHGPDTTARSQVVWQVGAFSFGESDPGPEAEEQWRSWLEEVDGPAELQARARRPDDGEIDVCSVAPEAMYRGQENQHYRVEIFGTGQALLEETQMRGPRGRAAAALAVGDPATFVWSRDNGSNVYELTSIEGALVTAVDFGRDRRSGLDVGDLVELVDDASAGRMAQEVATGPARTLFDVVALDVQRGVATLDRDPAVELGGTGQDPDLHPLLRRWEAQAAPVTEGGWLDLEDGVQVRFPGSSSAKTPFAYRDGDYWLVPARRTTGDVIWPQDDNGPAARPPEGTAYHYAPLAFVPANANTAVKDLRHTFKPIAP